MMSEEMMNEQLKWIARRIIELREIRGISAQEMAEKIGMPFHEYKEYEAGKNDFTFSLIFQIAGELDVDFTELITGDRAKLQRYSVVRKGKGLAFNRRKAYRYFHLAPTFRNRIAEPFLTTVQYDPANTPKPLNRHEGQEFDYVLEGRMKIRLGDDEIELSEGDSVYYDSQLPHNMTALDEKDCTFIAVIMK
ncbi:MAG: helix-turn-helix domain-containing protein [Christensenellales bacterium]|jgi:transcriptional regulator with XRE-family HTH domain